MPNLTATIPHQLSRAEAKRRIEAGLNDLRRQSPMLSGLRESWNGDVMDFTGAVLLQPISGRREVADREIRVEVALPGMLGALASMLKPAIEERGRQMLRGPEE